MYDAMLVFLRRDLLRDSWKKLLPPLLACGVFTGLGIASKWTAAYGALGLAACSSASCSLHTGTPAAGGRKPFPS